MDSAAYDSTDDLIIAVRGCRAYKCNATTGAIISQSDFQQLGFGPSSIVWDSVTNKCFATCWNTNNQDVTNFRGWRNISRIVPTSLVVDLVTPIQTTFSGFNLPGSLSSAEWGIGPMRINSGTVYGMGWAGNITGPSIGVYKFSASNIAVNDFKSFGGTTYPQVCYASVGGHDRVYFCQQDSDVVAYWDFTDSSSNTSAFDTTKGYSCIEYSSTSGKLYIPNQFQFIDVYTTGVDGGGNSPVFSLTIDTGRSTFNGVNTKFNSVDGLLYVAGGADNTVIVLNPLDNSFSVKTGFDLPCDFVFTPTKKFAVQQGSVGLREIT